MKLSLSWLRTYINFDLDPKQLGEVLTLAGLEVEGIESKTFSFSGVIVGEVVDVQPHPDADSLRIATVSDGIKRFQVVCGAPNCRAGLISAFAPVGAKVGGKKMQKGKLRGIESFGMLCGADELDLPGDRSGIMELNAPVGTDLTELYQETIIDVALTPNLGHCASVLGIARELSALLRTPYQMPHIPRQTGEKTALQATTHDVAACPRYCCQKIRGVRITPSPDWLASRLESSGIRPINVVVDITNYVMLELGQPLHAFDSAKIAGEQLCVKEAPEALTIKTLDGQTRTAPFGSLLIWDSEKPIAVAGVIGGAETEVSDTTTDIVLEAALFASPIVRATSKQLGVRTEASSRFEKGVDPNGVRRALEYASHLIAELAGGTGEAIVDTAERVFPRATLSCRLPRLNALLGTRLSAGEVESLLQSLEMEIAVKGETITARIPTYRNDITHEIDLIEEVARMYGYNTIEKSHPRITVSSIPHSPLYLLEKRIRNQCASEGLQEFLTCDLISPKLAALSLEQSLPESSLIQVLKPSSVDQSILRSSLLPSLLQSVRHNFDHQIRDIAAFEIGRIHFREGDTHTERLSLAIILTGKERPHFWGNKPRNVDFYDIKGIVENLLDTQFTPSSFDTFHPGAQSTILLHGVSIGVLGEVHPAHLRQLDIDQPLFFAQIDLHDVLEQLPPPRTFTPLPQYPGSQRDWTITLARKASIGDLLAQIHGIPSKLLKAVELHDIYTSDALGPDAQNVTLRFTYRDDQKTITHERVEKEHERITSAIGV